MAGRFVPAGDLDEILASLPGVEAEQLDVAQEIADGTRANAVDHQYGDSVEVHTDGESVQVTTDYSFAHLDEWGSANNPPSAAMRNAASDAGRFVEE